MSSKYLARSWSWASVNGPIDYYWLDFGVNRDLESVVVHGYHIQTSKESSYGAVKEGAYLTLTAPLAPLQQSANLKGEFQEKTYYEFSDPKSDDEGAECSFDLALPVRKRETF